MYTQDVIIQIHEAFLINKEPLGKQNNPHYNSGAREVALNLAIRGNSREDGNGYITINRTNKNKVSRLSRRNTKTPRIEPTMSVEELVLTMENYIYTDEDGDKFYPEIYGFSPYVKIAETDIDNSVPESLPNSVKAAMYSGDEEPVIIEAERQKTWHEWFNPTINYPTEVIEGYRYYLSYAALSGDFLTGEQLMIIHNSVDTELVDSKPEILI